MAVEIQLPQRSQLPPSRTGAVKPPTGLADQSGAIQAGRLLAKFGGDTFNRLEQTRVANEEAQFQGTVKAEMGKYDTFVAANPGASFNELEKERDKMLTRIRTAGNSATMPRAKQNNANWYTRNLDSIRVQTQTSMEAIQSKQQLRAAEEIADGYINSFDRDSLINFTKQQVESGLWEKTFAAARLENQLDVIDKAEAKVAVANVSGIGFAAWEATVTEDDPDGDLNAGFDAINDIEGLTSDQKQDAESTMKTRVSNRRAESKLELEQASTKSIEGYMDKIAKGEFVGMNAQIANDTTLTGSQKIETQDALAKRAKALNANTKTDNIIFDMLYTKSLEVWSGDITKAEFNKLLKDNNKSLDDGAYKELSKSSTSNLKTSQSKELQRANTEAGRLIVDHVSQSAMDLFLAEVTSGMAPDQADLFRNKANEIRQEQFFSLAQYNAETREWIDDPDNASKTKKDFFQFSEALKHVYWNKSREDIQRDITEARGGIEVVGETQKPLFPNLKKTFDDAFGTAGEEPVLVSDQAAYDKLSSGTRYVDKNGNVGTKK